LQEDGYFPNMANMLAEQKYVDAVGDQPPPYSTIAQEKKDVYVEEAKKELKGTQGKS
jgi:hypothetical protein